MDDRLEYVGICAAGHRFEKASTNKFATVRDTGRFEVFAGAFDRMRQVEQNPAKPEIGPQDGCQEFAKPSSDVGNRSESGEIVRLGQRIGYCPCALRHRAVEDRRGLGFLSKQIEM